MRKIILAAFGTAAMAGFATPALAQDYYGWESRHDRQHDRLDQRHDDVHDQLGEEHAEAHEQGLSPWEHRELHEQLREQHDYADYRIARQHRREHRRDAWRRYYRSYGDGSRYDY